MNRVIHGEWDATVYADDVRAEIGVVAEWDEEEPLFVLMTFVEPEREPTWEISRDLLLEAQKSTKYVGEGDVRLTFTQSHVVMTLTVGQHHSVIRMPRVGLDTILKASQEIVPAGSEDVEGRIDEFLEGLFEG